MLIRKSRVLYTRVIYWSLVVVNMFILPSVSACWPLAVANRFSSSFRMIYWPLVVLTRFLYTRAICWPLVVLTRPSSFLRKIG